MPNSSDKYLSKIIDDIYHKVNFIDFHNDHYKYLPEDSSKPPPLIFGLVFENEKNNEMKKKNNELTSDRKIYIDFKSYNQKGSERIRKDQKGSESI